MSNIETEIEIEEEIEVEENEKAPFRIHRLVTKPAGMSLRFVNRLRLIGQELAMTPVRSVGHAACDLADDCVTFVSADPLASVVLGLPMGGTLAALGLAPFLVPVSFFARLAVSWAPSQAQ
jgi:hypothetical protein